MKPAVCLLLCVIISACLLGGCANQSPADLRPMVCVEGVLYVDTGKAVVNPYLSGNEAVMALLTGKVDCVVIDNEPAKAFVAEVEGLKILETEYVLEDYAGAMSKDNTALYEAVNAALQELIADGTVKTIIDSYISAQ